MCNTEGTFVIVSAIASCLLPQYRDTQAAPQDDFGIVPIFLAMGWALYFPASIHQCGLLSTASHICEIGTDMQTRVPCQLRPSLKTRVDIPDSF